MPVPVMRAIVLFIITLHDIYLIIGKIDNGKPH